MAGLSSLATAVSGLNAAQAGLYVIGHNISNADTAGYVRQQVIQSDFLSPVIGRSAAGTMQLGLGTDVAAIRQIRDKFLDLSYRGQVGKLSYYNVKYSAGVEIENVLGELQGEYKLSGVIEDLWASLNDLSIDPTGLETRGMFVTTAQTFINKVNNIAQRLYEYQRNLNEQVKKTVQDANNLVIKIDKLNGLIADAEAAGDNANDYRDSRNLALDDLSSILNISYKERSNGTVDITCEGNELLANGYINTIGLRYSAENWDFVEPVFTTSKEILDYDPTGQNARPLFTFRSDISAANSNDYGLLKGLLISRGMGPADYTMSPGQLTKGTPEYFNVTNCLIPKIQLELDTLVHEIVKMINDTFAPATTIDPTGATEDPNAPFGLDGSQHFEIFTRIASKYSERYDSAGNLIPENPNEKYSLYTIGNIQINPLLLNASGYDKIPVSLHGDAHDNRTVLDDLLTKWGSNFIGIDNEEKTDINGFLSKIISRHAIETNEAKNYVKTQQDLLNETNNKRNSIMGVSMDEEMKNMLIYQHAYNAAARVFSYIDSMLDKLINGTGRVGL